MTDALYLYCVTPNTGLETLAAGDFPSLLGPIRWEVFGNVGAVMSPIENVEEWVSDDLLADADWATHRALHHARVIELVWEKTPVYPAQFGTLFGSVDSLKNVLGRQRPNLDNFFRSTAGMAEWGVKVFFNPREAQKKWIEERLEQGNNVLGTLSGGHRYLAEQQLRKEAKLGVLSEYRVRCAQLLDELTHDAAGVCERTLPILPDSEMQPIGHWAALWPVAFSSEINERMELALAEYKALAIDIQWSGPWPPYSFRPSLILD